MATPALSAAVLAARARGAAGAGRRAVRIEWFIENVSDRIQLTMKRRVGIATELLKSKVVRNISIAVVKGIGPRGGRVVTGRSKPGEFPRAETTMLLKNIFSGVRETSRGVWDGFVATSLDYGVILETRMHRSFLVRSLREERSKITRILTGPIKG